MKTLTASTAAIAALLALAACDQGDADSDVETTEGELRLFAPVLFHGTWIDRADGTMRDVDTLAYDVRFDLDDAVGEEGYAAEVVGYFAATRKLPSLELDFATAAAPGPKGNMIHHVELQRLGFGGSAPETIAVADLQIDPASQKITIPFATPIPRGQGFTLKIVYTGRAIQADGVDPNDFTAYGGFMARQKNSENRRIFLSLNWPNKAHWWLPLRDHPNDGLLTYLDVSAPPGFKVLGNGERTDSVGEDGKARAQFLSRTPMPSYDIHLAAYDGWVSEPFPHSSSQGTTTADTIPMDMYVYDAKTNYLGDHDNDPNTPDQVIKSVPTIDFARQEYALQRDAMNFYIDQFGPFRWSGVDFVEEPIFGGGMEHAMVVSMDETRFAGDQDGAMRYMAYHELAHHWSGNLVRIASWNDFWLSEGVAEYLTVRFSLSKNDPSYLHTMFRNSWRSEARRRPLGPSAPPSSLLHPVAPPANFPGLDIPASGEVDVLNIFDAITYNKGAMVMVMLEKRLGTEAFSNFLTSWFTSRAGRAATTKDLERALKNRFGSREKEIAMFFDQFVYGTYRPEVTVTTKAVGNKTQVKVEQIQTGIGPDQGYRFPLDVDLVDGAGEKHRVTLDVDKRTVTKTFPVAGVASVVVNPEEKMLVGVTCNDTAECPATYTCQTGFSSQAVQPPTPPGGTAPPIVDPTKLCVP